MKTASILVVVGPTASGKSELAVKIAKQFNGEIISADSRQIYRGLDIGSGKVPGRWIGKTFSKIFTYKDIPHYLIDEANPARQYSAAKFQREADKKIRDILGRGKLPIICGGTGHWIDAVVYGQKMPEVKPNPALRKQLASLTTEELFTKLKRIDKQRAATIDPHNPRRLIRALEITMLSGKPVPPLKIKKIYAAQIIGLNPGMDVLTEKINKRLKQRLKEGMVNETNTLHSSGLSWKKLESFGLEYKYTSLFLQHKLSETDMISFLSTAIRQYAKRQLTWWKKNKEILWFEDDKQALLWAKTNLKK